jgi:3,4-dihydroxy 2-butanone 4-phosphate synthase/GTP cyclohydrolase II
MEGSIARVEEALERIRRGEMVILVDDEDRENEGDLVMAAERIEPEDINFMAQHGRGLICLTLLGERLDELQIPMMVEQNTSSFGTAFTVSIEAREGVTTGISASDRARTIQVAVDESTRPEDIAMPGHIFPLRARDGGVLERTGQTEGSVDLARLAGLKPAGVVCEIMNPDGSMARMPELEAFAEEHDLVLLSIADIINYRLQRERLVELVAERELPTEYPGQWRVQVYRSGVEDKEHFCLICGEPTPDEPTLVRVQHRVDTFDIFLSEESESVDCLRRVMQAIGREGSGVLVYLDKSEKSALDLLRRYVPTEDEQRAPKERNVNRPRESLRTLGIGAQILVAAHVGKILVMTNNPKRIIGGEAYGLEIVDQVPIPDGGSDEGEEEAAEAS